MNVLHIDFETFSECDLKKAGAYAYAQHPSTDILCMAWAIGDEEPELWLPGQPFPPAIAEHLEAGGDVVAWNAPFERQIWAEVGVKRYGFPPLEDAQLWCAAAAGANMALPRNLGDAAKALGVPFLKDDTGHRVMLKLSKPRTPTKHNPATRWTPQNAAADFATLYAYCLQDVRAERAVYARLLQVSPAERELFLLDQTINDRGVRIDRPLIEAAGKVVEATLEALNAKLADLTGDKVTSVAQTARLAHWLNVRIADFGWHMDGVAAAEIERMQAVEGLPAEVYAVLDIRAEAAKSSTAKLAAMLSAASRGDRIRGSLMYYGASRTGRWAGRLHQPQNLPRGDEGVLEDAEGAVAALMTGNAGFVSLTAGPPMTVVSSLLRGMMIAAEGHDLIAVDFANIEGRVLAWCAGEKWKLQAFREYDAGTGPDLYKLAYSKGYGVPVDAVTKAQRQVGKVMELACGYQGWTGAFQTFASLYRMKITDDEAAKNAGAWREAHPRVVAFWRAANDAALRAVAQPGTQHRAGPVTYLCREGFLWCRLPSGRVLAYCQPSIRPNARGEQAVHFWGVDSYTKRWQQQSGYGGLWVENIVQAISRDLLAEAMLRAEAAGYPLCMTVHDEIVAEVPKGFGSVAELESIASVLPAWTEGLPVAASGWRGRRYQK